MATTSASSSRPRQPARSTRSVLSSSSSIPTHQRPSPPPPAAKPASLAKRLLFPTLPPDADLPPLLASPNVPPELNAELYDFLAIALRAHINPWWTKITRYDKEFLPEITRILTVVLRAVEARLAVTDLAPLVFRDLPTLLTQHWGDYRNAHAKLHTAYATGGAASLPQLFHQLQPHMAVSPDGVVDAVYLRQAFDHVLAACLPEEDYAPETERYIVREIILKVVLGGVLPRVTQPWFIHKIMLDQLGEEDRKRGGDVLEPPDPAAQAELQRRASHSPSLQSIAIFLLSAVQSISGAILSILHAYKQARDTIKKVNESSAARNPPEPPPRPASVVPPDYLRTPEPEYTPHHTREQTTPALPGALHVTQVSDPLLGAQLPPTPSSSTSSSVRASRYSDPSLASSLVPPPPSPPVAPLPNYVHPPLQFLLALLTPPPTSTPAASPLSAPLAPFSTATLLGTVLTLLLSALAPFLARLLPYLLYTHALAPTRLVDIVRSTRRALFPGGWPAPPPVDPTPEEQVALRRELVRRLSAKGGMLLGPTPEARTAAVDAAIAPLDNHACNSHLLLFVLDLVLLTVFPEMAVSEDG